MNNTLYERALDTSLHSRFIARAETLGRDLTDAEVIEELDYVLEMLPFAGLEPDEERTRQRDARALLRHATR